MRHSKFGRFEFADTNRKRLAYARKLRLECEAMPLFRDEVASSQTPVDIEMQQRRQNWNRSLARDRRRRAEQWVIARAQLQQYRPDVRRALLGFWQSCRWPAVPEYLLSMLHMYDTGRLEVQA